MTTAEYNALPVWDGKEGGYQYNTEDIAAGEMRKGADGTIYYITHEKIPHINIWCGASRLRAHLQDLYARRISCVTLEAIA